MMDSKGSYRAFRISLCKLCAPLCLCGEDPGEEIHHRGTESTQRTTETVLLQRLVQRRAIIQQNPLDNRQRQAAVPNQIVVKLAEAEVFALLVAILKIGRASCRERG